MSKTTKALAIMGVVAGLGVAALPMSSYATTDSKSFGVQTEIAEYLTLASATATDAFVQLGTEDNAGKITNNGPVGEGTNNITVKTNKNNGYYLQIAAAALEDGDTAPTALKNTTTNSAADNIPAGAPAQNSSAWGYKASSSVTGLTIKDDAKAWGAVPATNTTFATKNSATDNNGDVTTLTFGASADASQAAGIYRAKVVVTATSGEDTTGA